MREVQKLISILVTFLLLKYYAVKSLKYYAVKLDQKKKPH